MSDRSRRVLVFLATLAGMALMARLGLWQLDRAAQKIALEQAVSAQARQPAITSVALALSEDEARVQWQRPVLLQGEWMAQGTVYLDNRQMRGRPGFYVVTPLRLSSGDAVLVQRGWIPRDPQDRARLPAVQTPVGPVSVAGRIVPWPSKLREFGADAPGLIQQNVEREALTHRLGLAFRPLAVLELPANASDESSRVMAPAGGLLRDWPQPASSVHRHYGYAATWFTFCAMMAGLFLWFQILRPWRLHAKQ